MKKCILTVVLASGVLWGLPASAAPLGGGIPGLQDQVRAETVQVYHCRPWSAGWDCARGGDYGGHLRYYSNRRQGSSDGYSGGYNSRRSYGRYRYWGPRSGDSDEWRDYHSRYMSHQRYDSWKRAF